jgi:hypothetical protein
MSMKGDIKDYISAENFLEQTREQESESPCYNSNYCREINHPKSSSVTHNKKTTRQLKKYRFEQ